MCHEAVCVKKVVLFFLLDGTNKGVDSTTLAFGVDDFCKMFFSLFQWIRRSVVFFAEHGKLKFSRDVYGLKYNP